MSEQQQTIEQITKPILSNSTLHNKTTHHDDEEIGESKDISQAVLVMLFLLAINELLISCLNKLKRRYPFLSRLQPTTITTLVGIFAGLILNLFANLSSDVHIIQEIKSSFTNIFMIVLLPPILYESAINMERKHFFKNFGSILSLAIAGTIIATLITSILTYWLALTGIVEKFSLNVCFAFGSLISATDPVAVLSIFKELHVDNTIYTLIFGESTLNDAVSMILYDTTYELRLKNKTENSYLSQTWDATQHFLVNFVGSMVIGIAIGMISAYMLKNKKQTINTEITIVVIIPWVCYLLTSMLKMSGILSIMFCGISMARYAIPNLTPTGKKINQRFYHTLAHNFENLVFLFIGIGIVSFNLAWSKMGFFFFLLVFIIINLARYVNIVVCSYFLNKYRLRNPINKNYKFMMWFSGFRGAMAYALALQSVNQYADGEVGNIMLTITLIYANINVFINATVLEEIINKLGIKQRGNSEEENDNKNTHVKRYDGFWNNIRSMFELLDSDFLQKILITEGNETQLNITQHQYRRRKTIEVIEFEDDTVEDKKQSDTENQIHSFDEKQKKYNDFYEEEDEDQDPDFPSAHQIDDKKQYRNNQRKQKQNLLTKKNSNNLQDQDKNQSQQQGSDEQINYVEPSPRNPSKKPKRKTKKAQTKKKGDKYHDINSTEEHHTPENSNRDRRISTDNDQCISPVLTRKPINNKNNILDDNSNKSSSSDNNINNRSNSISGGSEVNIQQQQQQEQQQEQQQDQQEQQNNQNE